MQTKTYPCEDGRGYRVTGKCQQRRAYSHSIVEGGLEVMS